MDISKVSQVWKQKEFSEVSKKKAYTVIQKVIQKNWKEERTRFQKVDSQFKKKQIIEFDWSISIDHVIWSIWF